MTRKLTKGKHTMPRQNMLLPTTLAIFCAVMALVGCANKKVTISSDPPGAEVVATPVTADTKGEPQVLGTTPLTTSLSFDNVDEYRITVRQHHFVEATSTITYEPKDTTQYDLALVRESVDVPLVVFEPMPTSQGLKLAPSYRTTIAFLDVTERSPHIRGVTRVTTNESRQAILGRPVHAPVDQVLAYEWIEIKTTGSSDLTGEVMTESVVSNIWQQKIGVYAKTRVTYGQWWDLYPSFTPDGQYMVFCSNRSGRHPTLWRVKVSGSGGITRITNTQAEDYHSSPSPDNSIIAYDSSPPGAEHVQLWTIQSNGSLPSQLRDGAAPRISPDGKTLLFVRHDRESGYRQIWLMDVEGATETQLTQNHTYDVADPQWSPDGSAIAFASNQGQDLRGRANFDIWIMASDGSNPTQLTTNGSWDDGPSWDPTGKWIYFRSNRGGAWNIWRLSPLPQ